MRNDTGDSPAQIIVYAIQRGSYDKDLSVLAAAIDQRRQRIESIGHISPSIGDWVEMWEDENCPYPILRSQRLRVVGFTKDKHIKAQVETPVGRYARGAILKIHPDWVYQVHYYAKIDTPLRPHAPEIM